MKARFRLLVMFVASMMVVSLTTACANPTQTTLPRSFAGASSNPLNDNEKTSAWAEQLLGEVLTYKAMAENGAIQGQFNPYVDVLVKARDLYRGGDREATYTTVNQFMTMLEVRAGDIDPHIADRLWDSCYRWTPDQYHARERHVRAVGGQDELRKWEEFIDHQQEKASLSF